MPQIFPRWLLGELAPYPGRMEAMLRLVVASAIIITVSMTLQVPLVAISLIVAFFVTRENIVLSKITAILLLLGTLISIAVTLVVLKLTLDFPLLRILLTSLILLVCFYLMRVLKLVVVFFQIALVLVYGQSLADVIGPPETLVRLCLWAWVAISYGIAVALLVNLVMLPADPRRQLSSALCAELDQVGACLTALIESRPPSNPVEPALIQHELPSLSKLLKFSALKDPAVKKDLSRYQALVSLSGSLYIAAAQWNINGEVQLTPEQKPLAAILRDNIAALSSAVRQGHPFMFDVSDGFLSSPMNKLPPVLREMVEALQSYHEAQLNPLERAPAAREALLVSDAFSNAVYWQFAIKTLLATLACYVFYLAVDWPGIHTIMLTCVIIALPSLGAVAHKGLLRISGAFLGSLLALAATVFLIPHLDSIVGLLAVCLPVIALSGWISAGNERTSYAGVQIMFAFALALLEQFSPVTELTEIRDRLVGVVLGVTVTLLIQRWIWPESAERSLRHGISQLLQQLSGMIVARNSPGSYQLSDAAAPTWERLQELQDLSTSIRFEPGRRSESAMALDDASRSLLSRIPGTLLAIRQWRQFRLRSGDTHSVSVTQAIEKFEKALAQRLEQEAAVFMNANIASMPCELPLAALRASGYRAMEYASEEQRANLEEMLSAARALHEHVLEITDWHSASRPILHPQPAT